jgi:hypothetical protein
MGNARDRSELPLDRQALNGLALLLENSAGKLAPM